MLFAVVCTDRADTAHIRARTLDAHRAYIDGCARTLVTSGPLLDDDGTTRNGQLYIIDVADRAAADTFVSEDPFTQADLFATALVRRIKPVIANGLRIRP